MNKAFKTILIFSIVVFGLGVLFTPSTFAQAQNLVVQFETTPLFSEANFLPGQNVTRWVKVTNNSGQPQRIATEAINVSDPNWLGNVLNLEIKEGGVTRYNNPLSKFFTAGEVYLSNLAGGGTQTQYDFIVTFYSGAGNPFQGKSLKFDILIGFQGAEGGLLPGAGGGLPPGLTIQDETVRIATTTETSVTITWLTSYFSTSQVIYAAEGENHTLDLTDISGTPPKYGYAHTTPEYDTSPKVTAHSVTITGLTPGTKYYYRTISHASLAVSREYSFTTLALAGLPEISEIPPAKLPPIGPAAPEGMPPLAPGVPEIGVGVGLLPEEGPLPVVEEISEEELPEVGLPEAKEKISKEAKPLGFFAGIGALLSRPYTWIIILLLLIIFCLVLVLLKKKRKEKDKTKFY